MSTQSQQPIILWGGKEFLLPPEIVSQLGERGLAMSRGNRFFNPSFSPVGKRNKALRYVVEGYASMDPLREHMGDYQHNEFKHQLDLVLDQAASIKESDKTPLTKLYDVYIVKPRQLIRQAREFRQYSLTTSKTLLDDLEFTVRSPTPDDDGRSVVRERDHLTSPSMETVTSNSSRQTTASITSNLFRGIRGYLAHKQGSTDSLKNASRQELLDRLSQQFPAKPHTATPGQSPEANKLTHDGDEEDDEEEVILLFEERRKQVSSPPK